MLPFLNYLLLVFQYYIITNNTVYINCLIEYFCILLCNWLYNARGYIASIFWIILLESEEMKSFIYSKKRVFI